MVLNKGILNKGILNAVLARFGNTSGAPNYCFLYYICLEKQTLSRIFFCLRTAKKF